MGMLWVAAFGLVINLIGMRMLSSAKDASLNLKGAYLEVWVVTARRRRSVGVSAPSYLLILWAVWPCLAK